MWFSDGHLLLAICDHLTLLSKLFNGVYVGLLSDLPLGFLDVVQVEGRRRGSETRRGLVSDCRKRGQGRHGRQGAHVGQGSSHSGCSHARHSGTHGDV